MTTASRTRDSDEQRASSTRDDVIPVDDVPAFGVQIRFAKRTLKSLLSQLRNTSGSTKDT